MTKAKKLRKINRNIFDSKLYLHGLTLAALGKILHPPVTRSRVSQILANAGPDYRLQEIARLLETNVTTLFPKMTEQDATTE